MNSLARWGAGCGSRGSDHYALAQWVSGDNLQGILKYWIFQTYANKFMRVYKQAQNVSGYICSCMIIPVYCYRDEHNKTHFIAYIIELVEWPKH